MLARSRQGLRTGSLMSASVFAPAEGSVAELALVLAFRCERRLPRGGSRGRRWREDCDACAGHLDGLVSVVFDIAGWLRWENSGQQHGDVRLWPRVLSSGQHDG